MDKVIDSIMVIQGVSFSIKKYLGEEKYQTYLNSSDKVKALVRLKMRLDVGSLLVNREV